MGAILNFSEGKLGNIDIRYYSYLLHYTMFSSSLRKTRDVTIISNDILTKWQKALHNCRWRCYESFETQINNVCFCFFIIKFLYVSSQPSFLKFTFELEKTVIKLHAMPCYLVCSLCLDTYLPLYTGVVLSPFLVHTSSISCIKGCEKRCNIAK